MCCIYILAKDSQHSENLYTFASGVVSVRKSIILYENCADH